METEVDSVTFGSMTFIAMGRRTISIYFPNNDYAVVVVRDKKVPRFKGSTRTFQVPKNMLAYGVIVYE